MMKDMNRIRKICFLLISGTVIFILPSCKQAPQDIPFPGDETEFPQPVSSTFKFSEGKKIKWEPVAPDSVKPFKNTKIDFEKLPSVPFDLGDFHPMLKPMVETKFDLDLLPDTLLDIDMIPAKKINFKVSMLGQPIHTKALRPHIHDNAVQGIFEYGQDQGLSTGGGIGTMFQDSRGFLWISTLNGLLRFDGEYFDLYTASQGLTSFNNINAIWEDRRGQIWLGSDNNGIDIINLEEGILKHLEISQGPAVKGINEFMVDKQGKIWVSAQTGISIIDPINGLIKDLSVAKGMSQNNIGALLEDNEGNIWAGARGMIYIIEVDKKRLRHLANKGDFYNRMYKDDSGQIFIRNSDGSLVIVDLKKATIKKLGTEQGLISNTNYRLALDHLGQIWVSSAAGVDIINLNKLQIKHLDLTQGLTNIAILLDDQNHIWMSNGYAEIDYMDLNGRMFQRQDKGGLKNGAVRTLFEDHESRVWIANSTDTIYIADPGTRKLRHIDNSMGLKLVPSSFLQIEDQMWMSSYEGGVYIYNLKTGVINFLSVPNKTNAGVSSNFLKDRSDDLWLYGEQGIILYSLRKNTFRKLVVSDTSHYGLVNGIFEDEKGNMWIASDKGIDVLDPVLGNVRHLIIEKPEGLKSSIGFASDGHGRVLIQSYGYGIYLFDTDTGSFVNFTANEGLASDQVTSIIEKNGNIYVGTSEGLSILSFRNSKWSVKNYGRPQLFNHVDFNPTGIVTKNNRFWWGVGADGIIVMDENGKDTMVPPTYINGIDIMEQPQHFSNKMLLANIADIPDTIWSMNADTFYLKRKLSADINDQQTNHIRWDSTTGPLNLPINLTLPYNQNYIRFHFTGTHLGNMDKTRYRYILEGQDKNWSKITDLSFASYISLAPGQYHFKVSSRGFNGLWSKPVEMRFTITPPWWKTWWAYLLFTVCACIIVWGGITVYRTNRVKAENIRLEKNVVQRTKELKLSLEELKETQALLIQQEKMASLGELTAGIAHEIQNPLNFVNNFSDLNSELIDDMEIELNNGNIESAKAVAKDIRENEQKINHHGKRADAIVKGMLQHSRVPTGLKEPTDLNRLADEYLRLAYHGLRAKDKSFNVELQTHFDESIGHVNVVAQDIGRVLLNLFNNAFYATEERKKQQQTGYEPSVSVSTKNMGAKILISVKDNGMGVPNKILDKIFQPFFTTKPTGQGTGLGLSLSYDIIKAHAGELKLETKEGEGSEFLIQIPKG
jgi:signal transduction histidine kinase/ligand-binding sensor domain-containing protein